MEKLPVFINKYAGYFKRSQLDEPVKRYAREAGFEPIIVPTRNARELHRYVLEKIIGHYDKIALAGGDGTIHSAVQVLAGTGITLGILPQGTANNFATALHLPLDLPSAFQVIANNHPYQVDLGMAGNEYFTEAAGVGLFADALAISGAGKPGRKKKSLLRSLSAIVRLWIADKPYRLQLEVDGQSITERAVWVTVANTFRLGPAIPIAPTAKLTDSFFDLVILGDLTRSELLSYFKAITMQQHTSLPKVQVLRAREVTIRSRKPINVHVDDRVKMKTPVTFKVAPGALCVFGPAEEKEAPVEEEKPPIKEEKPLSRAEQVNAAQGKL